MSKTTQFHTHLADTDKCSADKNIVKTMKVHINLDNAPADQTYKNQGANKQTRNTMSNTNIGSLDKIELKARQIQIIF